MRTHPRPSVTRQHQVRLWVGLAMVVLTLVAGCGDDDSGTDGRNNGGSATTSSTATTQPPASDEEAAFPIVEDLVLEATALADELFQNPTAVEDPDNPELARLREIYTDDSATPEGVIDQLRELADNGQRERPSESGIFRDLGVYRMAAVDDNTVRFRICATEDSETIDEDGEVVEQTAQVVQGVGEARRIDGIWRFYGIHLEEDRTLPIAPGSANPGFCDALFADGETQT